jgi:hypothetical protein
MNRLRPEHLLTYSETYNGGKVFAEIRVDFANSIQKLSSILSLALHELGYYILLGRYNINMCKDLDAIQDRHTPINAETPSAKFMIRVADAGTATWYSAKESDILVECDFFSGKIRLYKEFDTKGQIVEE